MTYHINKKGFTLIELLVVIAIIGVLSSVVYGFVTSSKTKARNAYTTETIQAYIHAASAHHVDKGYYPTPIPAVPNNSYCLGEAPVSNECWGNPENSDLNDAFALYYSGLPSPNPHPIEYEGNARTGSVYSCTAVASDKCIAYRISWHLEGVTNCGIVGSETTTDGTNTYCEFQKAL